MRKRGLKWMVGLALLGVAIWGVPKTAFPHGFRADRVHIEHLLNGQYRVTIWYTHLGAAEYRVAHVDFEKKAEAVAAYRALVAGADFFLGDVPKSIHTHTPPPSPRPW